MDEHFIEGTKQHVHVHVHWVKKWWFLFITSLSCFWFIKHEENMYPLFHQLIIIAFKNNI